MFARGLLDRLEAARELARHGIREFLNIKTVSIIERAVGGSQQLSLRMAARLGRRAPIAQ